jgi:hypothetical protein
VAVTRVGDRTGQSKLIAAPTSVVEEHYRQLTHKERVEFTLCVRKELADGVIGAIKTLARVAANSKNDQAATAAARQIVLLSEKHGILKSSADPLSEFTESFMAELESQDARRED